MNSVCEGIHRMSCADELHNPRFSPPLPIILDVFAADPENAVSVPNCLDNMVCSVSFFLWRRRKAITTPNATAARSGKPSPTPTPMLMFLVRSTASASSIAAAEDDAALGTTSPGIPGPLPEVWAGAVTDALPLELELEVVVEGVPDEEMLK